MAGRWEAPDGSSLTLRSGGALRAHGYRIEFLSETPERPEMRNIRIDDSGRWWLNAPEPGFHGAIWRRVTIGFAHPVKPAGGAVTTELTLECSAGGPVLFSFIGDPDEDRRLEFRRRD